MMDQSQLGDKKPTNLEVKCLKRIHKQNPMFVKKDFIQ
jgi:hypothetical protein